MGTAVFALLFAAASAHAYTPTVTPNGTPVRWKGRARLALAGNPVNRNGLGADAFYGSVVRGLQRWNAASGGAVTFDYWQGTDSSKYEPDSEYNGLSSIYFASNARGSTNLSPNVLGLTQVWYNTDSGEILEADVVLNDLAYQFTTDPRDTTGFGLSSPPSGGGYSGSGRRVFIENVITHELGHAFGLSHSGGLQSTMLFMESPEQAFLGCDEQVGIRALYAGGGRGAISGQVVGEQGQPIFGAHVVAVSRRRGTALATALTDKGGRYSLNGLEPGTYFLMAEPFYAGANALPSYYSGVNPNLCAGEPFARTILTDASGSNPVAIGVGAGASAGAPTIVARCSGSGGAAVTSMPASSSRSSAPVVFTGGSGGFGIADRVGYSNTMYYRVDGASGRVEVHALAYSLYSPIAPAVSLVDEWGANVPSQRAENVYVGTSGYVNHDSALVAENLPAGTYYVKVTASSLSAGNYPAGPVSIDTVPFLLVTGSVNEGDPALASQLPVNGRCRMEENFAAYSSPPGDPERHGTGKDDEGVGFCGTISELGSHGGGDGDGPGPGAIAGWFLPWVFMAMSARVVKKQSAGFVTPA